MSEPCTIIVTGRDKFSPTFKCLEALFDHTPEPHEIIVVLGGAPKKIQTELASRFQPKVKFIFESEFLTQPKARNIGLKAAKTRLAIVMDNDVFVRPGWLLPLLQCQTETAAVMVVPLILEKENIIHTAGNCLYITHVNGKAFGYKELPLNGMVLGEKTNLKRKPADYGELHCQLVDVALTLRLGAYDENIREVGECDSGLTWAKAGLKMYFEPKSVVFFNLNHSIRPEDVRFFAWRWDMRAILKGYQYFEEKWNMDITEFGDFRRFLLHYNQKLGFWARIFPSSFGFRLERMVSFFGNLPVWIYERLLSPWRRFLAWRIGYYEWPVYSTDYKNRQAGYR